MLAIQLKNFLKEVKDDTTIMIYDPIRKISRGLIFSDLDIVKDGTVFIDTDYEVPNKKV